MARTVVFRYKLIAMFLNVLKNLMNTVQLEVVRVDYSEVKDDCDTCFTIRGRLKKGLKPRYIESNIELFCRVQHKKGISRSFEWLE